MQGMTRKQRMYGMQGDVDGSRMDLISTSNYIKNFNVFYEEVLEGIAEIDRDNDDFVIIDSKDAFHDYVVVDPVTVGYDQLREAQMAMSFDLPLAETKEPENEERDNIITFSLDDEVKDIEVKNPVEVITVLEYNKKGETRYSLDDYINLENRLTAAKAKPPQQKQEAVEEEMQIEKKAIEFKEEVRMGERQEKKRPLADGDTPKNKPVGGVDPMESPIDELLKERADERRRKLKDFNYKFQNSASSVDDIEREPAYKRHGVDLNANPRQEGKISRTSLGEDSNDEIQLRSNNSFLHDNVD